MKLFKGLAVLATSIGLLGQALVGSAGAQLPDNTVDNRILIITENLEEAYSAGINETADQFEVPNFVDRVLDRTPSLPDVLLMQEVNERSTNHVAREFTRRTGQRYVVVVRPPLRPNEVYGGKSIHTETAIIINATTMRVVNAGGFFKTTYPRSAAASGQRINTKRHAHALLAERGTDVRVPVMSAHLVRTQDMKSVRVANHWRGEWAQQIESFMDSRYNADKPTNVTVIGGDWNVDRCWQGSLSSCRVSRLWDVFTSAPHVYNDALYDLGVEAGVDMFFTHSQVHAGGWDKEGTFSPNDRARYYSDHRFRWVTVGP
jgi:hypothetical protein